MNFKIESPYKPTGDQPQAIKELTQAIREGVDAVTLLGVTGSGKTHGHKSVKIYGSNDYPSGFDKVSKMMKSMSNSI